MTFYTQEEFKNRIVDFKMSAKPYAQCQPHEWGMQIFGRMATAHDYGVHLEKMLGRARDYDEFISGNRSSFSQP